MLSENTYVSSYYTPVSSAATLQATTRTVARRTVGARRLVIGTIGGSVTFTRLDGTTVEMSQDCLTKMGGDVWCEFAAFQSADCSDFMVFY